MRRTATIMSIVIATIALAPASIIHAQAVRTPVLRVTPAPFSFDTTFCSTQKCRQITFANTGDTGLTVYSVDGFIAPFSGTISTPFTLQPGGTKVVDLCYQPQTAPSIDSQVVAFRADSRVSTSFSILIDGSANMLPDLEPGVRRYAAVDSGGKLFFNAFRNSGGIADEGEMQLFRDPAGYLSVRSFTGNSALLYDALPDSGIGTEACIYDAVAKAVNSVKARSGRKIIVLVTATHDGSGGACGPISLPAAIALANEQDIAVYAIGMGDADQTALAQLCSGTGGQFYYVSSVAEIKQAFATLMYRMTLNIEQTFTIKGQSVAPFLEFTPDAVNFYTTTVGVPKTAQITVRNTGDASADIKPVTGIVSPFSLQGSFPATLAPGAEVQLTFAFNPSSPGYFEATALVTGNSCRQGEIQLPLRGVGYSASEEAKGPILVISPSPVDFDTVFCHTEKCRDVSFTNIGDTALTVTSADAIAAPFSGSLPVPFQLQPNETRLFNMCYLPPTAPAIDSQQVHLIADTRVPLSIALLFDVSGSMTNTKTSDGIRLIDAANNAGTDFISGLLNIPEIQDEAAVFTFEAADNFALVQPWTSNKSLLAAAVPTVANGTQTCIYDALDKTIAQVAPRSQRRVVVILTDGVDGGCGGATPSSVIASANSSNVVIYTIGIGTADHTVLTQIATSTGGQFYTAETSNDLVGVYRAIATSLSKNVQRTFTLRGEGVSPVINVSTTFHDYDSIKVGLYGAHTFIITNTGNAALNLEPIQNPNPNFLISNPPTQPIPPGGTYNLNVLFQPLKLRIQRDTLVLRHNSCSQDEITLLLTGIGWDQVTVELMYNYTAKPGHTVAFPLMLKERIPAEYEVTKYSVTLSYNKTLLYPLANPAIIANTPSAPMPNTSVTKSFDAVNATTTINVSGGTLVNTQPNSEMVNLGFTALLGNTLSTEVRLTDVTMEDGNPRVRLLVPAVFSIDSLCFLEDRLLDARQRQGMALGKNAPNPFGASTVIPYVLTQAATIRLSVFDSYGREVAVLVDGWQKEGTYTAVFDASNLESGVYFYRLDSPAGSQTNKMHITR